LSLHPDSLVSELPGLVSQTDDPLDLVRQAQRRSRKGKGFILMRRIGTCGAARFAAFRHT
jgi:hypothetical protein